MSLGTARSTIASESQEAFSPLAHPDQSVCCGFAKGKIHTEAGDASSSIHVGVLQIFLLGLKARSNKLGVTAR